MKKRKKLNKKVKKRLIILAILAGAFLVFSVAAVELTSRSGFCASCHFMTPFFESWETSSHGEIECSKCHYPPGGDIRSKLRKKIEGLVMVGRYWTKLYVKSKPWAEIKDDNCLQSGCHDKRLLEGQVPFNNVLFDHKVHFEDLKRGKQLQCVSCHSQIVQGEHITVTESSCFICHFKESEHYPQIDDCGHCHNQETLTNEKTSRYNHGLVFDSGFACDKCHSNTIIGDGEVPLVNCYKCHGEPERLDKYDDTDLMHSLHISINKIECNHCHMDIQHKIYKDIETIADCQSCHTDYHQAQKVLYAGEGGRGVDHPVPNIMLEKGLSCKGCHIFHEESGGLVKSDTLVSEGEACESCHGRGFARILRNWESSTAIKLTEIRAIHLRASREVNRSRSQDKDKADALMKDALFNIEIVDKGKSVHNMAFSQELLLASFNSIVTALESIKSSYRPAAIAIATAAIPTQCSNCHAGIEENTSQIFGMNFHHKEHILKEKQECSNCHSNVRTHGEFIATKQSCAGCHHQDTSRDCSACHELQATFYQGGELEGLEIPKDIMAEAEAACTDCHHDEADKVIRSDGAKCLDCHDEGYEEMFDEWQDSFRENVRALRSAIRNIKRESLTPEGREELSRIQRIVYAVRTDGSSGVHNAMFFDEIATALSEQLESLSRTPLI
jgi:nitrate/TMAO reductase-like tetraheme cytochrome c subunit